MADGGADKEQDTERALEALNSASELIDDKAKADAADQEQLDRLPILKPGQVVKREDVGNGFRLLDGYGLAYNGRGDIKVGDTREGSFDKEKIHSIVMKYPAGCVWSYWTDAPLGPKGLQLGECINTYGTGTLHRPGKDLRIKFAYVSDACTIEESFFLFAAAHGGQVMLKICEDEDSVFRVYRSAMTDDIKSIIALREMLNIRQQCSVARFWEL